MVADKNGNEQISAALGIIDPDDITNHLALVTDAQILRFVITLGHCRHKLELVDLARSRTSSTIYAGLAKK